MPFLKALLLPLLSFFLVQLELKNRADQKSSPANWRELFSYLRKKKFTPNRYAFYFMLLVFLLLAYWESVLFLLLSISTLWLEIIALPFLVLFICFFIRRLKKRELNISSPEFISFVFFVGFFYSRALSLVLLPILFYRFKLYSKNKA